MAPGAKKNPKAKSKKALAVDFKRVKSKVGRKLAPAQNSTKVEFKSKGIVIPGQSVTLEKDGLAVNCRKQTLKELLVQVTHYSERMRKDALVGLKDLFEKHPKELVMHAVVVVEKLSPRITDTEKSVRQALVLLLRSSVLPILPQTMMKPLVPVIMAHICSAMTHLVLDIRIAACTFLDLLVQHSSSLVVPSYSSQIVQHYIGLLGKGGISGQPGSRLTCVLECLENFLSALKQSTMATQRAMAGPTTHIWGHQQRVDSLPALHAYKSAFPEGNLMQSWSAPEATDLATQGPQWMQNTGRPEQSSFTSTQVVPVLLECWAEYAPMVCIAPNPDLSSLECMVLVAKCLRNIFQTITAEAAATFGSQDMKEKTATIHVPELGSEEWETHLWMRQEFLRGLRSRLLNSFPMCAPVVRLLPKVEVGLVALNVGICEVLLQFVLPITDGIDNQQLDVVVEYVESALYGKMLPSSQFSEGKTEPALAEPHVKSLISYLPGLITCVSSDWVSRLLQAFTHVFESCNSRSSTKMACLSSMTELVLGRTSRKMGSGKRNAIPPEFQTSWLQSLPKLLWELKHLHPNVSQAVLEMLLWVGRTSPDGSALAESFNGLQQAMVPFFCTFLRSKQNDDSRCLYGPFIKLPQRCQELATDLLYYYSRFSRLFLKVLAQCSLCPDLDAKISVRIVEVVHRAGCRGDIDLADHLSFLVTLLAGHTSSQAGSSLKTPPMETGASSSGDYHEDLDLEIRRRHGAITGVVCSCLPRLGDGNLVLDVVGPSMAAELENQPQLRVINGFFRAVAVLTYKVRDPDELFVPDSDGLFVPDSLVDVLPKSAANFLVTIAQLKGEPGRDGALNSLKRPCIILMARSPKFTLQVLKVIHEFLRAEVDPPALIHAKQRVTFVQVVLEIIKTEKLDSSLSSSRDTVKAIMQTIAAQEDTQTNEGRELKRLHDQLRTASNALFGSGFLS